MENENVKFNISLDFDPGSDRAPAIWKAIAGLLVATNGEDGARAILAEAHAKSKTGEAVSVERSIV